MFAAAAVVNYSVGKFAEAVLCGFFFFWLLVAKRPCYFCPLSMYLSSFCCFFTFGYVAMLLWCQLFYFSDLFLKWDWLPTFHY